MEITDLLRRAHDGDSDALEAVTSLIYDELKNLASRHLRRERKAGALQTTVLVHEDFLRLAGSQLPHCENRSHLYGIAARVMRQVLVDMARVRQASKRGPGLECSLTDFPDIGAPKDKVFLSLNDALERLARESPLKAKLIELHFFAGLTAEESAELVSVSVHTIRRELRLAKVWLQSELAGEG
jgi:RNA polymerase sigma factor (TIGR02999 family)